VLGTGSVLTVRLPEGQHEIAVTATARDGRRASAPVSVNIVGPTASQTSINAIRSTLDTKLDATLSSRASEASVSALGTRLQVIETRIDAPISSRASAVDVAAIGTKVDQLKAALPGTSATDALKDAVNTLGATLQANQLRTAIEQALANLNMIASFYLPTANGGQLDLVRSIVLDVISKSEAAGGNVTGVGRARRLVTDGDTRKTAGDYKGAYLLYAGAYQALGVPLSR
jgi:hypothetical protein